MAIDCCLAWSVLWLLLDKVAEKTEGADRTLVAFGTVLAASFFNQVVLTLLFRASVGKLITGIRVIRAVDGGRPRFWRTVWRWLSGLCWVPLQPWYWLRSLYREIFGRGQARGTVRDNDDGELYDADLAGLRCARRKDLRNA
ncbi:RDD family protein [Streptomyces sp. NBC_01142]|uniref:RDD family protein n=1 Tax=Streptomyces sp. NBC_01142 TaxID=2975865 RepID=UPI00224E860D|nr:RDD family protein [Streptomyces sp. NBC_01142]MCX4818965.1 RDD family protein [Streptomyces sp. NBC_01142]